MSNPTVATSMMYEYLSDACIDEMSHNYNYGKFEIHDYEEGERSNNSEFCAESGSTVISATDTETVKIEAVLSHGDVILTIKDGNKQEFETVIQGVAIGNFVDMLKVALETEKAEY